MEALSRCNADLTVYVHPSKSNNVRQAVSQQLSSLLFKYDEVFEGVMLAYDVTIKGNHGKILPGLIPHFGVKVDATLLLFSPRPNMLVEGKVVKLGKESIHVIIFGFSSASILVEDISSEFKYRKKDGVGVFSSIYEKRHVIRAGSMIRFSVKSFDEETLHLYGSLKEANTGCIRWLSRFAGENSNKETESSLKRDRESDITKEKQEQDPAVPKDDDLTLNTSRPPKSRKRHRESDITKEKQEQDPAVPKDDDLPLNTTRPPKSRKRHRESDITKEKQEQDSAVPKDDDLPLNTSRPPKSRKRHVVE